MFSHSLDGEYYYHSFDTREEAIADATSAYEDHGRFYVGEIVPPRQPELFFHAESWMDHVSDQDDYGGEWAEDWNKSTGPQLAELDEKVRAVMSEWLDRHKLRPTFWNIGKTERFEIRDEKAVPVH